MYKSNQEPDIPAALGLLSHLDNDELKELLNNDGKFEDIVKDIKQVGLHRGSILVQKSNATGRHNNIVRIVTCVAKINDTYFYICVMYCL